MQPAFIHIDLDGFWSHLGYYGISHPVWPDPVYSKAVPLWLEILKECNVRATFFVIGIDLSIKEKKAMIKKIYSEGHEIANHSFSHDVPLASLSKKEKYDEIMKSHKLLGEIAGEPPVGFRAPSFSLDDDLLDILEDEGYLYDSSLFASPYGGIVQAILNRTGNKQHKKRSQRKTDTYGKFRWAFAPCYPYKPMKKCLWKEGNRKIWEVPVTTLPFLKFPFHFSFVLAIRNWSNLVSEWYCGAGIDFTALCKRPLLYLFHGLELTDPNWIQMMVFQPGTTVSIDSKMEGVYSILKRIQSRYEIVCLKDFLKRDADFPGKATKR